MFNGNAIMNSPLLTVRSLGVGFGQSETVLRNVGFDLARGEILGLVGESGSGKSGSCNFEE